MKRIELPAATCVGLDMPDGTRYEPKRYGDGYIEVERPDHAQAILGGSQLRERNSRYSLSRASGQSRCAECGFISLLAFCGRPCPKCNEGVLE